MGTVLIAVPCLHWMRAVYRQRQAVEELAAVTMDHPNIGDHWAIIEDRPQLREGEPIARVKSQRIGLSAVVFEGWSDNVLDIGVGHDPKSALPNPVNPATGNVVLAAHRDTFFRPLRKIHTGDEITLQSPSGEFRYRVTETSIVTPEHVEVLAPTDHPVLTMITCYPFTYIGNAPKRFIVRAEQVGKATQQAHRKPDPQPSKAAEVTLAKVAGL